MKRILMILIFLLVACTIEEEPIVVTRMVATAVPPTITPTAVPATIAPTAVPRPNASTPQLEGTEWRLLSWSNRDLPPGTEITLGFAQPEEVAGFVNCRHYTSRYVIENDAIQFPTIGMDPSECDQNEATIRQELDFTTTFSQITRYQWQEEQLALFTDAGDVLIFEPFSIYTQQSSPVVSAPTATALPIPEPIAESPIQLGLPQTMGRGQIVDAAFTPDGTGVAVAWAKGVSFTAVADAHEQWFQPLPANPVAIDIRHDGQEVAVALANGSVAVFRVEDGRSRTYPVARSNAYWGDIAYAPSGSQIAVQFIGPNRADPLYILDIARVLVSEVPQSQGNEQTHPYLVWSPDGTAITLASLMETCAHILDVQTGERLFKLQNESGCYDSYAVVWSPDGRTLTLNSPQGMIETIEFASQKVIQSFPGSALTFQPSKAGQPLFISPDGRWLASKGGFGFYGDSYPLQVWRTEGELVGQMESDRVSHRLVSSFAGESVLSLYDDGTLTRWAFAEGAIEEVMGQLPVYVVRSPYYWSPDGRKIATPTDNEFVIWDVVSAQPMAAFDLDYLAAAFSPDSRLIALADWQTEAMIVYDLDNQAVTQTFADVTARGEGVAFSPDGRLLAYGSGNEVIVVDVATGAETAALAGYPAEQAITKIIWSPTGTALAAASGVVAGEEASGTMIVWGQTAVGDYHELFRTESVRTTYPQYIRPITLFNPSGTLVALEDLPLNDANYFTIFVYDLEQEAVILELDEHQLSGWESDELLLTAEAQYDTRLTQWDVRTGASALGQASDNGGLTFAPTGGYYAQMDGTGANIARGVEVRHWQSNLVLARAPVGGDVGQIGWSPDGRFLAATAGDGSLTIWPVLWRDNE